MEEKLKKLKIIRFNDDNHAERLWANGVYLGTLADIDSVIEFLLDTINDNYFETKEYFNKVESTSIWVCDDFDEDIDEDIVDDIWEWFNTVEIMTQEQINLVEKKEWLELHKII